jgi:ubiquitin-activating enzyme E1
VDEKLYSRQLYVMGHEAQRKMMASSVLLVGCSGLGVEIAKNCILAGVKKIVLLDDQPANDYDLGANFYLKAGDANRAEACGKFLSELNPYVQVETLNAGLATIPSLLTDMTVCVVTVPLTEAQVIELNEACRANNCCFIYSTVMSVFGQIFCDFGDEFIISDKDGEAAATSQIESVLDENPAVVKVLEDHGRHGLEDGDKVQFARLQGVSGLETGKDYTVKVTGPYTFELLGVDLSSMPMVDAEGKGITQQGYITQIKQPVVKKFKPYKEDVNEPGEFMLSDFAKFDRPPLLHLAFRSVMQYLGQTGKLPEPGDQEAIGQVLEIAKSMDKDNLAEADSAKRIIGHLSSGSQAILSPMCATIGGMVGQEVLKACSSKFTPISGFFYLDADDCLPDSILPVDQLTACGRYTSQIAVFGQDMQLKINDLQYFIVGAGAIGCEMLKNWAMMGVGCGEKGRIVVTDMDRIEKSNLSRQVSEPRNACI